MGQSVEFPWPLEEKAVVGRSSHKASQADQLSCRLSDQGQPLLWQNYKWGGEKGQAKTVRNLVEKPLVIFSRSGISILLRQDPLEAILVIFGCSFLSFFCLKGLGKIRKMTPVLCACAVVITLDTQKCRKKAPLFVEFSFYTNRNRRKRFSLNERRRADLQSCVNIFNFSLGTKL